MSNQRTDDWKDYMNPFMDNLLQPQEWSDWHANNTIFFGELIESRFNWGKEDYFKDMDDDFDNNHRERLNQKIEARYFYREICCTPPGKFKHFLVRKLNELLPKYNELYKVRDAGDFHVLRQETKNSKYRHIYSEYPQTQLKGDADYATNGQDNAAGSTVDGPPVDMFIDFHDRFDDIDVMIIDQLEVCFWSAMSNTINGGV